MAKKASKKASTVKVSGTIPKLSLSMPLDEKKIKAIRGCIAKGQLTITVNKVDLARGRIGEAWLYD